MSEDEKGAQALVPIIALPQGHTTSSYLGQARLKISNLAVKCKRYDGKPPETPEVQGYIAFVHSFLPWLETDATMTPIIRNQSKIDLALKLLFDPVYKCPPDIADRARRIYDKFEDEQWGRDNDTGESEDDIQPTRTAAVTRGTGGAIRTDDMYQMARPPPPDHPIWGKEGIMHGFIIQSSQYRRFNYVLNPLCEAEKRNFKVFGHNGLEPGDWWPYQKVALFHGAHGHSMAGISGDSQRGAWSVVVSGSSKYEDLDKDLGDTIWYSSDQSHDNTDPARIVHRSNMTLSLHTSIANGKPVRVLRSSGFASSSKGLYAPSCGIRYDGLYAVVEVVERKNSKGGLYEQFHLVREPDQRSLAEIRRISPTRQQVADYRRIQEGY
jgi:hypothetical protein